MIEEVRREIDKIRSALISTAPFLCSLLRRARIVASRSVPLAAVDRSGTIYLNVDAFMRLPIEDKCFTVCHEVMHIAFYDNRKPNDGRWNVACDAVNNYILRQMIKCTYEFWNGIVTMEVISGIVRKPEEELEKMCKEEIYKLLPEKMIVSGGCGLEGDLKGGEIEEGEVIQEGDREIYGSKDERERAEKWKEAVAKAYTQQKSIGKVPGGLKRIVDELIGAKIPWQSILRQCIRDGLGKSAITTWRKLSRKHVAFPGIKRLTTPNVWILIDTSGSISDEELKQFVSEVYEVAKQAEVIVVPWDAEAYQEIRARNRNEVISRVARMLRGGKGTVIKFALSKCLKNMKAGDVVAVLTDGDIWDVNEEDTRTLFSNIKAKASSCIFATTHTVHEIPGWTTIKIS